MSGSPTLGSIAQALPLRGIEVLFSISQETAGAEAKLSLPLQ
jgi:hypothetical protein